MKSKTVFVHGNRLGSQYAPTGLAEYASKWRIYNPQEHTGKTPAAKLLDFNISLTGSVLQKIAEGKWYLQNW